MASTGQRLPRILEAEARYRSRHRRKLALRQRQRYIENRDTILKYHKSYNARAAVKEARTLYDKERRKLPHVILGHRRDAKTYAKNHPLKVAAQQAFWRQRNVEMVKAGTVRARTARHARMGNKTYSDKVRGEQLQRRQQNKLLVFKHYGGFCACCRESILEFLCIDHINGNGNKHRKEINIPGGSAFYSWLIRNGLPGGYQVLCHNCNMAKCYGVCPHMKARSA